MNAALLYALALVLSGLATQVLRASPAARNRCFAAFTFSVAGWVLGIAGVETGTATEFWGRVTFASASLIPTTLVMFSHVFPAPTPWLSPPIRLAITSVSATLALLSLTTPLIAHDIVRTADGIRRSTGPLYPAFATFLLLSIVGSVVVFVRKWTQSRGLARAQAQYVVIGILAFAGGALTTNLLVPLITGTSPYSWLGPYFTLPLVALVAHAIIRHRLMDLRIIVHRGIVNAILAALIISLLIVGCRLLLDVAWSPAIRIEVLLAVGIVLSMLTVPIQRLINRLIDPYLFRGRADYALALRRATHVLTQLMEPHAFAGQIRSLLAETVVPETVAVLLYNKDDHLEFLLSDSPRLSDGGLSEILDGLAREKSRSTVTLVIPTAAPIVTDPLDSLHLAGVEVVIILRRDRATLGMVLLGPRRSGEAYFAKELSFLEALSDLAAIALENNLLHQQRVHILEYSERLLESLESAVVAVDPVGTITNYNPAATQLLGLPPQHAGLALGALPTEVAWAVALAVRGQWVAKNVEASIDVPSVPPLPVVLSTAVLRDVNRELTGALVVVTDLSTVKALERNQRRLEHLSLMARFYAGITHEIRNPLAAISNFVSMLPDRFDDPEYRDTAARLLPLEVARITALADRLRLMAPGAGGKLTSVSVRPLLNDIIAIHSPVASEANVRIVLQCPESLPQIKADASQLIQLFVNLFRNAMEAMPDGGNITVEATSSLEYSRDGTLSIRVLDEGVGIDPSIRSNLFEPFFTTKATGTGLGLAICREIATFHGAQLSIVPRSDRIGTAVEVQFPYTQEPSTGDASEGSSLGLAKAVTR